MAASNKFVRKKRTEAITQYASTGSKHAKDALNMNSSRGVRSLADRPGIDALLYA